MIAWTIYWIFSIVSAILTRIQVKVITRGETILERFVQNELMITALYLIYSPYLGVSAIRIIPAYFSVMIFGCIILISSLVFAYWARCILAGNRSSAVQSVENQNLVTQGPYKFIRHPIYTGIIEHFWEHFLCKAQLFLFLHCYA